MAGWSPPMAFLLLGPLGPPAPGVGLRLPSGLVCRTVSARLLARCVGTADTLDHDSTECSVVLTRG